VSQLLCSLAAFCNRSRVTLREKSGGTGVAVSLPVPSHAAIDMTIAVSNAAGARLIVIGFPLGPLLSHEPRSRARRGRPSFLRDEPQDPPFGRVLEQ
jgi:hypothetical protein